MRAASLLLAISAAGAAQSGGGSSGGTLTPRVHYAQIDANSGSGLNEQRHWLQAVVLWRGQLERSERAGGDSAERTYRDLRRAAEDAGRTGMGGWSGGGIRWAEYDRDRRWLYVLGQQYRLPQRDSALVVMVDRIDGVGGAPAVVGTAWIGAELPDGFWPKHWTSGDTVFMVMPRRNNEILLDALRRSPAVREFLR